MDLNPDWREFVESLNSNEVEYLIVGAVALAFHGLPRLTGDIDFFVRNSPGNATRTLQAVEQFGFRSLGLKAEDFMSEDRVVQLRYPPRRIDILTKLTGIDFETAWSHRQASLLDDIPVNFISKEDFVANKRARARTKDLADAEAVDRGDAKERA